MPNTLLAASYKTSCIHSTDEEENVETLDTITLQVDVADIGPTDVIINAGGIDIVAQHPNFWGRYLSWHNVADLIEGDQVMVTQERMTGLIQDRIAYTNLLRNYEDLERRLQKFEYEEELERDCEFNQEDAELAMAPMGPPEEKPTPIELPNTKPSYLPQQETGH